MSKVFAAVLLFAVVHSGFASLTAKRFAAQVFGVTARNRFYRLFYLLQSIVTFLVLGAYLRTVPSVELYRVEGPLRWLMHVGQGLGVLWAFLAAYQIGIPRVLGITAFRSGGVVAEPQAQGPALDEEGLRRNAGPFAWSRHPLNFAPLPILWLWPTMGTTFLAFNVVATIYLVLGSLHEEHRLRATYGDEYRNYQRNGTAFFIPWPTHSPTSTTDEISPSTSELR